MPSLWNFLRVLRGCGKRKTDFTDGDRCELKTYLFAHGHLLARTSFDELRSLFSGDCLGHPSGTPVGSMLGANQNTNQHVHPYPTRNYILIPNPEHNPNLMLGALGKTPPGIIGRNSFRKTLAVGLINRPPPLGKTLSTGRDLGTILLPGISYIVYIKGTRKKAPTLVSRASF